MAAGKDFQSWFLCDIDVGVRHLGSASLGNLEVNGQ